MGSVHLEEAGFLILSTEQQVTAFLPKVSNLTFSFFDGGVGALQFSGSVRSAEPLCNSEGRPSSAVH
jgi:hypothetical protein